MLMLGRRLKNIYKNLKDQCYNHSFLISLTFPLSLTLSPSSSSPRSWFPHTVGFIKLNSDGHPKATQDWLVLVVSSGIILSRSFDFTQAHSVENKQ